MEAAAVAFGVGAAFGWIVHTMRTRRPSSQSTSPKAELVISLLPDAPGSLRDWGELTDKAELVIVVTRDPHRETQR